MALEEKSEEPGRTEATEATEATEGIRSGHATRALFRQLSILDRLLSPLIIIVMVVGVVVGQYRPNIQQAFETVRFNGVSLPIAIGLIIMMWPILTKVQYERLREIFSSRQTWIHISISLALNWIAGPLIMLALAWATLPDLPTYRTGVILVGLARCIAMVMMWNQIAKGNGNYCAILVVVNSILQIVLYSPYALLFINVIGHQETIHVEYKEVAISVLIYLGIPLAAGIITRYGVQAATGKEFFNRRFLPIFSPLSLLGLLYTIFVMFAYQGHHIIQNLGPVFRVFVPMILYFMLMWTSAFALIYYLMKKKRGEKETFGYEMAVVQAFTAGSNNFELAIAVAIAVFGVNSDQALAATIGPLVEVPVLLALTWVSLWLKERLDWLRPPPDSDDQRAPKLITPEEVAAMIEAGENIAIVDVRQEASPYGFVRGSHKLPAETFDVDLPRVYSQFKDATRVIFYCNSSGGRGVRCAAWYQNYLDTVVEEHQSRVYVLQGGAKEWLEKFGGREDLVGH